MKRLSRILIFTGLLTAGAWSQAQTFEQSLSASDRGDDRAAFAGFKKLGEEGNSKAQFNVGLMYRSGRGVAADDQQAAAWYRKAAEQGDVDAQYNLAEIYRNEQSALKDEQTAYFWLLLASAQGHQNAARNRDFVVRRLSLEARTSAETAARNWRPTTKVPPGR